MLTFIGLGLYDENDISLKGLDAIKNADVVYAEFYTSRLMGSTVEKMEVLYGKHIHVLAREDVEQRPKDSVLKDALDKNVVFLTGGDTMVATTHVDLRLRAKKMGIETRLVHGSSISTAVCGLTGLQNYRFGKSATVAFPYKNIISETPYDTIKMNKANGLHSLIFLDIDREKAT
jgi:diphthine synthase